MKNIWRKSSHSTAEGNCIEVGHGPDAMLVRDTKDHGRGQVHRFTADEWRRFVTGIKASGRLQSRQGSRHPCDAVTPSCSHVQGPSRKSRIVRGRAEWSDLRGFGVS